MIDTLGEINGDEDNAIMESLESSEMKTGELLEDRYGFAQKLKLWKDAMTPSSVILFFEPFTDPRIFAQLKFYLDAKGWRADIISCDSDHETIGLVLQKA